MSEEYLSFKLLHDLGTVKFYKKIYLINNVSATALTYFCAQG